MIVRNEGHQLDECLSPIADLFDDIVIVDTLSRDNTRQVAERYTRRVFDFPWCDSFSAARNASLRHARGDWVFWLDADDRVSQINAAKLSQLFRSLSESRQAFLMPTILQQDNQARDPERVTTHLRLFPRDAAFSWQRRVHETIVPWPSKLGYEMVFTDIAIDHLGYRDTLLTQRKLRRNLRLLRMEYAVAPQDPCVLMDLGSAHAQLGESALARKYLRLVLAGKPRTPLVVRRAYMTLAELASTEGDFVEAATVLTAAVREFPRDEYLLYMYSEALYSLGRYAEAEAAIRRILQQPPNHEMYYVGAPRQIRERLAPLALGELLRVKGALREAEATLRGVADARPADPTAWFFLGRLYIDWRDWPRLDEVMARLHDCPSGSIYAEILHAVSQFAQGNYLATEKTLDRLIPEAPYMTLPRVLRAECLYRRKAALPEQIQACRDILRIQPRNRRAREILSCVGTAETKSIHPHNEEQSLYSSVVAAASGAAFDAGFECLIFAQ